ncbi:MAG: aspartate/glutamate racemase family protein [Amphritea sp.]
MKILVINPNISQSVTDLIESEARRSIQPGTELTMATAPYGVAYIETRAEALIGGCATLEIAAEHYKTHDAIVVAAFGDPGLTALREAMPIPVVGMTESAVISACMQGGRFSVIAISQRIKAWYQECITSYGLDGRLASIRGLDEELQHIGRVQENQGERLIELAHEAINQDGADTLIMAGAPLAGIARTVSSQIPVPVLDGVTCALTQAQAMVNMGAATPSAGSYAQTPEKPYIGLSPALSELIGRNPLS